MADITSNLVAHWKLDETSGTTAADSSGSGYTGTYVNSPTLNQTGAFGTSKAVTFASASSQHVTVTPTNLLRNVAVMTIAAWCKSTTAGTQYIAHVSSGGSTANPRLSLRFDGTKLECLARAGDAEAAQSKKTTSAYNNGNWHHVVGVVDIPNDLITVYVDGVAVATTGTVAFTATATSDTSPQGCRIGSTPAGTLFLDGTVDDVRIYSRALSAEDVAALYAYTGFLPFILDDCD